MKYKKTTVDAIIQTLAKTGDRRIAWEAAGITESTFYEWMSKHSEFSESVLMAEKQWRDNLPQAMRTQATKAFEDYLFGRVTETWTTVEDERTIVKRLNRGVPQWAIERVLGKPMDLFDAIKILVQEQILPPEILNEISNELVSCTARIRKILSDACNG